MVGALVLQEVGSGRGPIPIASWEFSEDYHDRFNHRRTVRAVDRIQSGECFVGETFNVELSSVIASLGDFASDPARVPPSEDTTISSSPVSLRPPLFSFFPPATPAAPQDRTSDPGPAS